MHIAETVANQDRANFHVHVLLKENTEICLDLVVGFHGGDLVPSSLGSGAGLATHAMDFLISVKAPVLGYRHLLHASL